MGGEIRQKARISITVGINSFKPYLVDGYMWIFALTTLRAGVAAWTTARFLEVEPMKSLEIKDVSTFEVSVEKL